MNLRLLSQTTYLMQHIAWAATAGYLLTYLCGHNNPIIGFRPALKLLSNAYAVVPAGDDRRPSSSIRTTWPSQRNRWILIRLRPCHWKLIQRPVGSNTVVIANSYLLYLFCHYNLLQVLPSANLRRHTSRAVAAWRQFRISDFRLSSTCLAQRWRDLVCDIYMAQIRKPYKLGRSYPYEWHDPVIEDAVF